MDVSPNQMISETCFQVAYRARDCKSLSLEETANLYLFKLTYEDRSEVGQKTGKDSSQQGSQWSSQAK